MADGGSQPLRSLTWEWQPPDPCEGVDGNDGGYGYTAGYLPAGNDLPGLGAGGTFTEEEAQTLCRNSPKCRGFTYSAPTRDQTAKHNVLFKSSGDGASEGGGLAATAAQRSGNVNPPFNIPAAQHEVNSQHSVSPPRMSSPATRVWPSGHGTHAPAATR